MQIFIICKEERQTRTVLHSTWKASRILFTLLIITYLNIFLFFVLSLILWNWTCLFLSFCSFYSNHGLFVPIILLEIQLFMYYNYSIQNILFQKPFLQYVVCVKDAVLWWISICRIGFHTIRILDNVLTWCSFFPKHFEILCHGIEVPTTPYLKYINKFQYTLTNQCTEIYYLLLQKFVFRKDYIYHLRSFSYPYFSVDYRRFSML